MHRFPVPWRRLGALLLVLLGGGTLVVVLDDGDERTPPLTVTLGGPRERTITLGETGRTQLEQIRRHELGDHAGLRDERPRSVPAAQLDAGRAQQRELARHDRLPDTAPLAAPEQTGCSSRFVRNFSSRGGVAPRLWVLHYTVSSNRAGWDDVDAIVSWFDQARAQASSHYVIDHEGHCAYVVRETDKAWTQAGFNPLSISAEIVNTGREQTYAGAAGLERLAQVVSDSARRWGIPLQRGAVAGCRVTAPGLVDHRQLGACGGGHGDIAPPYSVQQVLDAARALRATAVPPAAADVLTARERRMVTRRCRHLRRGEQRFAGVWRHVVRGQMNTLRLRARAERDGWRRLHRGVRYQLLGAAFSGRACR